MRSLVPDQSDQRLDCHVFKRPCLIFSSRRLQLLFHKTWSLLGPLSYIRLKASLGLTFRTSMYGTCLVIFVDFNHSCHILWYWVIWSLDETYSTFSQCALCFIEACPSPRASSLRLKGPLAARCASGFWNTDGKIHTSSPWTNPRYEHLECVIE